MSGPAQDSVDGVGYCHRHPDRETLVRCSHCDRPICPECMTPAAVGMRCPDCARSPAGVRRPSASPAARAAGRGWGDIPVTFALMVLNCLVFLGEVMQSGNLLDVRSSGLIVDGGVAAPLVADGGWYRLVSAGFLHASITHLLFNMWALWVLGGVLERVVGFTRMAVIYGTAVLWGSAGALLLSPDSLTVGASGGVFGVMAALLVVSRHRGMEMMGSGIAVLLLVNLAITFTVSNISVGGHLGGLAGGALSALVLARFGRGHVAYSRLTPAVWAGCTAVAAVSLAVTYLVANGFV